LFLSVDYSQINTHTVIMKKFLSLLIAALVLGACVTSEKPEIVEFTVNLNSPQIPMGEIEVQFDKTFPLPGIKKGKVIISYYPREDAVCLRYMSDLITYYQFWNKNGRAAFINALAKYKNDYDARSLNSRGGRKAKKEYGVVYGYLIWQLHRYAVMAKANVNIEIGYSFRDRAPYFSTYQPEANYVDPIYRDNNRNSTPIAIYFTRAQADELAVLFDQEYLQGLSLTPDVSTEVFDENDITADEY